MTTGDIGAVAPKPVVDAPQGVTRGVHGFHPVGEHPFDKENAAALAEEAKAEGREAITDPETGHSGVPDPDGVLQYTYEVNGVRHQRDYDPNAPVPEVVEEGEPGSGTQE